jgi:rhodanese-related sulfurtransferase
VSFPVFIPSTTHYLDEVYRPSPRYPVGYLRSGTFVRYSEGRCYAPGGIREAGELAVEADLDAFLAARADGAVVIDVREPFEYAGGHVPGAQLIPLASLPASAAGLPGGEPVYIICATGSRSLAAARFLAGRGFDARSVAGGTSGWLARGLPVACGERENVA